jgi:hypothetical protein
METTTSISGGTGRSMHRVALRDCSYGDRGYALCICNV